MATHSSILAWRIPWTEEPGGLQSMGSQRVEHNCATKTFHFSKGPVKGQNQEQLISGATYLFAKKSVRQTVNCY